MDLTGNIFFFEKRLDFRQVVFRYLDLRRVGIAPPIIDVTTITCPSKGQGMAGRNFYQILSHIDTFVPHQNFHRFFSIKN